MQSGKNRSLREASPELESDATGLLKLAEWGFKKKMISVLWALKDKVASVQKSDGKKEIIRKK
jgi:hypothetical protein